MTVLDSFVRIKDILKERRVPMRTNYERTKMNVNRKFARYNECLNTIILVVMFAINGGILVGYDGANYWEMYKTMGTVLIISIVCMIMMSLSIFILKSRILKALEEEEKERTCHIREVA